MSYSFDSRQKDGYSFAEIFAIAKCSIKIEFLINTFLLHER